MHSVKPHVCFVAPNAYAALSGRKDLTHIGGAEIQQALLVSGLVRCGHKVDIVTLDHGQPEVECINGVRILKICKPDAGWPGLRFLHPRWTSLWHALFRSNADIYYQRAAGVETGQVAMWCHLHKRPFVFAIANDTNCDPSLPDLKRFYERWLYRWGIRHASHVTSQTDSQAEKLRRHFNKPSTIIRNGTEDPLDGKQLTRPPSSRTTKKALWIGRFGKKKRLDWLLVLAQRCHDVTFEVIGDGNSSDPYVETLKKEARSIPNVLLRGRIPHTEMGNLYDSADVLVSTSLVEGFPNIFLEAWARGLPIVSTFDPDEVIHRNQLGIVAHTIDELKNGLKYLLHTPQYWLECSRRARTYFLANHSIQSTVQSLSNLFCSITGFRATQGAVADSTNAPTVHAPIIGRSRPS